MKTSHLPQKNLGQNFLIDTRIQQRIVDACALQERDVVVEIGPGKGAITHRLLPLVSKLIAIEKDRQLAASLIEEIQSPKFELVQGDFLRWDMNTLADGLVVVGNIPYYISTPIVEKVIASRSKIKKAFLTVQLEFGERLAAASGSKDYGSLSCYVQYYMDVKVLFKISSGSFHPKPKVESCFVSLTTKETSGHVGAGHALPLQAKNEERLFNMIQKAFTQRRKTIMNALKGQVDQERLLEELQRLKVDPRSRPEDITLLNYIEICNKLVV